MLGRPLRATTDLVLHHEHLVCDTRFTFESSDDPVTKLSLEEADLADVRRRPRAYEDNLTMGGKLVRDEIELIPTHAPALVDVTLNEIGRSPQGLKDLAHGSKAQIFMGCGRYVAKVRTQEERREPAFFRDEILRDLEEGVDGVRAAVIGEIGVSNPMTPLEEATLTGAVQAQQACGAPLLVHIPGWTPNALEVAEFLISSGANPERTLICHLDWCLGKLELSYHIAILRCAFRIAFDTWGDELTYSGNAQPSDDLRIRALLELADRGFAEQVLHSNDISTKTQLARFGGPGYVHLPKVIFPELRRRGLADVEIDQLFLLPALRFLAPDVPASS